MQDSFFHSILLYKVGGMMAIDSHIHIQSLVDNSVAKSIEGVCGSPLLESVINVGLNYDTSLEATIIAQEHAKFYASVGIHPLYIAQQDCSSLYALAEREKVVAIGEIGLDCSGGDLDLQKKYLVRQIMIANELHLPVIIHSNMNKEVISIFQKYVKPMYGCVFHCFQPDIDDLHYLISEGFFISFAGRITYKNAKKSLEVAKMVPEDLFLVETDSPYLSPEHFRDCKNTPLYLHYIIEKVAEVREQSFSEIDRVTTRNTKRLFKKMK